MDALLDSAARNRIDSFKFGAPTANPGPAHRPSHSRSHSRNISLSSSSFAQGPANPPFAMSHTPSNNSLHRFSFPSATNSSAPPLPAATKRNSHHRRRSSVSTRTESAELMGVSLPELPPCNSEDNLNLGDKDSIRRRALWALEGKPDVSFAKVEIPDITTPTLDNSSFDLPVKPGGSLAPNLASMLANKRDSFKLLAASSSSKDQLHTLMEEEEEDEEPGLQESLSCEDKSDNPFLVTETVDLGAGSDTLTDQDGEANSAVPSVDDTVSSIPARARPNLRPLSLKPEKLVPLHELPTPASTPSPRSGLKRLSLSPSAGPTDDGVQTVTPTPTSRRPQLTLKLAAVNENPLSSNNEDSFRPRRRSSITYKPSHDATTSLTGLPTPEMTPTFRDRRFSIADSTRSDDEFFPGGTSQSRPLSASEQHFLVKSHKALLARITDLEQALTHRRRTSSIYAHSIAGASRPSSIHSDITSHEIVGEHSDETFKLVADLKAERDELKRDIDGWRTRVGDMEKQMTMLTTRIDAERRDAWVARSQARLLEAEKAVVEKKLQDAEKVLEEIHTECRALRTEKENLVSESEEIKAKTRDLEEQLKTTLMELKKEREEKNKLREEMLTTTVPTSSAHFNRPPSSYGRNARTAFSSTDSAESSATEVEMEFTNDCEARFSFMLKAVQEEDETNDNSEEDNGLAGYEDEEESDASFRSSSSFDLSDSQSEGTLFSTGLSTPRPHGSRFPLPEPSNSEQMMDQQPPSPPPPSWSNWTFPRNAPTQAAQHNKQDSIDHFFGCLENESGSDGTSSPHSLSTYSVEQSKSLFCNALKDIQDDDNSPFFMLPPGIGVMADEKRLEIVLEEEEDALSDDDDTSDGEMFGEMGGIRITLSPPRPEDDGNVDVNESSQLLVQAMSVEKAPQLPMLNFGDEDDTGFNFDKALERSQFEEEKEQSTVPTVVISPPEVVGSPSVEAPAVSVPTCAQSPVQTPASSIPRPTTPRSSPPSAIPRLAGSRHFTDTASSTRSPCITPPSKRGGPGLSFIPQPMYSPPTQAPATIKSQITGNVRSVRQPQRKPQVDNTSGNIDRQETSANACNQVKQCDPSNRLSDEDPYCHKDGQQAQIMKSVDLTQSKPTLDIFNSEETLRQYENVTNQTTTSTLASIMTSPITAKLTSFIPFSWGAAAIRAAPAAIRAAPAAIDVTIRSSISGRRSSSVDSECNGQPQQTCRPQIQDRGFVTRQHQLEKLKRRMNLEGTQQMSFDVAPHCRKCSNKAVVL